MPTNPESASDSLKELTGVLPSDETHVWIVNLNTSVQNADVLKRFLNKDELDRAARFKVESAQVQFVVSRASLKIALARYLGRQPCDLKFTTTSKGKPELDNASGLRFNLSHTEGLTAFAITRGRELGIDVERLRANVEFFDLAERFFSPPEALVVKAQTLPERMSNFFSIWTAKEAYVKAHGDGLSIPLNGFRVKENTEKSTLCLEVFQKPQESARWSMSRLQVPSGYVGALAIEGTGCKIRQGRWSHSWSQI